MRAFIEHKKIELTCFNSLTNPPNNDKNETLFCVKLILSA